jgi:hypothetical protein
MDKVNEFKEWVGWDETPVIGLHIRTGNAHNDNTTSTRESTLLHRRVGGKLQENIGLEQALYLYMDHASALAARMGLDSYRVLVVTDSNAVLDTLGNMSDIPHWMNRPQIKFQFKDSPHSFRCRRDEDSEDVIFTTRSKFKRRGSTP